MLILGSRLHATPIMSLQTGTRLAQLAKPIIDPANLKIMAYEVEGPLLAEHPSFIRTADIREYGRLGMIVDSTDEFIGLDDVIKIKELHALGFPLVGMHVIDERKHKLGKVADYTLETGSYVVQQLNVNRGFLKGLNDTGLLIHRSQIVEINDQAIVVKTAANSSVEPVMQALRGNFTNPFRKPASEPETANSRSV
jgi:uncharacterized protein YrrD